MQCSAVSNESMLCMLMLQNGANCLFTFDKAEVLHGLDALLLHEIRCNTATTMQSLSRPLHVYTTGNLKLRKSGFVQSKKSRKRTNEFWAHSMSTVDHVTVMHGFDVVFMITYWVFHNENKKSISSVNWKMLDKYKGWHLMEWGLRLSTGKCHISLLYGKCNNISIWNRTSG